MFRSLQKSSGADWTATLARLGIASGFGSAILSAAERSGRTPAFVLAGSAAVLLSFAALTWHRYSRLTIPALIDLRSSWR